MASYPQCKVITKSCFWQVSAYEKWLDGEVAKQGKLRPEQDPVLKSADVDAKLDDVRKLFNKLKNKKKPKPPPPPPTTANDTTNATGGAVSCCALPMLPTLTAGLKMRASACLCHCPQLLRPL